MKKTGLIFLLFAHQIFSQNDLSVTGIPDILKQNMDAVVRYDNNELTIESKNNYTFKRNWAVTVFNEIGESEFAAFKVNYDKFSKIKKIEGKIYDATGKELKALKNSDIKDYGMGSASDDITDNRIKIAEFDKKYYPYPYTVEFSYEERSSNMLFLPGWFPVEYDKITVQKSTFSVICPTEIKYQKKEILLTKPSVTSILNDLKTEAWSLENYVSPKVESFIYEPQVPSVIIAPLDFTIEDFNGSANSWSDLAKFYHALNKNRDKLPEKTISEVQEIAKNEQTTEQKVKKIYEYVQAHTRYQSIQLGIGGWQTRLATEVAEKGYGDCKALTNYTIALLKAINIEAYPALIKAGEDVKLTNTDLPRMAFNHVIACIPMTKDTLWLECTSEDNPFGYQGDFTGNRKALLIKPEKGSLVNTINYKPEHNLLTRKAEVIINETGDSKIILNNFYSGIQQDFRANLYKTKSPKEQKDWLIARYQLPNIQIVNNSFATKNTKIPELTESIEISSNKLGSVTGKRMFIKLNLFSINQDPPAVDSNRVNNLFLNPNSESYIDVDSVAFQLPQNYKIESIPKDFSVKYAFGEYQTSVKSSSENSLVFYRKLKATGGFYIKEKYSEYIDFLKKIKSNDRQRIVLVKKET